MLCNCNELCFIVTKTTIQDNKQIKYNYINVIDYQLMG